MAKALVRVLAILLVASFAEAAPQVWRVLIVPIDFPDRPGTLDFGVLQTQWVDPLVAFWDEVSYGELVLQPTVVPRVSRMGLPRRFFNPSGINIYPSGTCAGSPTISCTASNNCPGGGACNPVGVCSGATSVSCQVDADCSGSGVCRYTFGFCSDNRTPCVVDTDCFSGTCSLWNGICGSDRTTACTSSADCPGAAANDCRFYWEAWEFDEPMQSLIDDGLIDKSAQGLTPPGAPAGDVFDTILFIDAIPNNCATCLERPANRCSLPGVMWPPRLFTVDAGHTYRAGYAQTAAGGNACAVEPGEWGTAAHEVGHAASLGRSHPAGYISNYELMDSAYPCSPGIYSRSSQSAVGAGLPAWFPGWVPDAKILTLNPPTGTTEVLAPVEFDPNGTASPMALKINVSDGTYYLVECRKNPDPANRTGCWTDGMLILRQFAPGMLNTNDNDVVLQMQMPPVWPTDPNILGRWRAHWDPNDAYPDTFVDVANDLSISVGPLLGDGSCTATVAYGPGSTASIPDVGIIPWLTQPMSTWETVDIWIDSSCNGYEADDPADTRRLKYGRRPDDTVIGNGDDPCIDHENRVYARVRNLGSAAASDVVVRFDVTDPLGVGIRGPSGWQVIGSVDKTDPDALCLGNIPPGGFCDVYVPWNPTSADVAGAVAVPLEDARFALHSCVRNRIDAVSGEPIVALANQDGNREQENIGYFEVRRDPVGSAFTMAGGNIFLHHPPNNFGDGREFVLSIESELPPGWDLEIGDPNVSSYHLGPGQTHPIPVRIQAPSGSPVGDTYSVKVEGFGRDVVVAPDGSRSETVLRRIGGVLLQARTVIDATIGLSSVVDPPDSCGQVKLTATGCLLPAVQGALLTVDYRGPTGTISRLAETDASGCFLDETLVAAGGTWTVQAIWQGDETRSSAVSMEALAPAFDPADRDCDGLPNGQDPCPDVSDQGLDSDEDGAGDACDCDPFDPGAIAAPPELVNLEWLDPFTLTWDDLSGAAGLGTLTNLLSGGMGALPLPGGSDPETCAAAGIQGNIFQVGIVPAVGEISWFLGQGENSCGVSPLGPGASGPRQSDVCLLCPHAKCVEGAALDPSCDACVASICQQDSYCCTTAWDSVCVEEVRTICGSLTCGESAGQCAHTLCSTGVVLSAKCDAPPLPTSCVDAICAQDPYCCNTAWDSICVGEVTSICGYNCD